MLDLNQIFNDLFKYATSVVDVIKQASSSIDLDLKEGIQTGLNIFQKINLWFQTHIGTNLVEIFKAIGHAIIWVLEKIISLLKGITR